MTSLHLQAVKAEHRPQQRRPSVTDGFSCIHLDWKHTATTCAALFKHHCKGPKVSEETQQREEQKGQRTSEPHDPAAENE